MDDDEAPCFVSMLRPRTVELPVGVHQEEGQEGLWSGRGPLQPILEKVYNTRWNARNKIMKEPIYYLSAL